MNIKAEFVPGQAGNLYAVLYSPPDHVPKKSHVIVFIPPFFEELNKSRKMISMQARALAESGLHVLILDLFGTGDSEGDYSDARWPVWLSDIETGVEWLKNQGLNRFSLWSLRSGALLAIDFFRNSDIKLEKLVMWSPVLNGELMINQFLRLRLAVEMMNGRENKETTKSLRARLHEDQVLEVAGYEIHSELVEDIDKLKLSECVNNKLPPVYWFEMVSSDDRPISPASVRVIDQLEKHGIDIETRIVKGDLFWSVQEIAIVPALIDATVNVFVQDVEND